MHNHIHLHWFHRAPGEVDSLGGCCVNETQIASDVESTDHSAVPTAHVQSQASLSGLWRNLALTCQTPSVHHSLLPQRVPGTSCPSFHRPALRSPHGVPHITSPGRGVTGALTGPWLPALHTLGARPLGHHCDHRRLPSQRHRLRAGTPGHRHASRRRRQFSVLSRVSADIGIVLCSI